MFGSQKLDRARRLNTETRTCVSRPRLARLDVVARHFEETRKNIQLISSSPDAVVDVECGRLLSICAEDNDGGRPNVKL